MTVTANHRINELAQQLALEQYFSGIPDGTFEEIIQVLDSGSFPATGCIWAPFENSSPSEVATWIEDLFNDLKDFGLKIQHPTIAGISK